MSVQSLMTKQAVFIYRVVIGSDDYGQPVYDFVAQTVQCYYRYQNVASTEDGGFIQTSDVEMFLHAGTQTVDLERVEIGTEAYIPDGVAAPAVNARTGGTSHLILKLRRGES